MANELQLQKKISNPLTPKKFSNNSVNGTIERIRVEDEGEIEKKYQLKEVLGKGAFGVVREVLHKESKKRFAMKTVLKDKVSIAHPDRVGGSSMFNFVVSLKTSTTP